MSDSEGATAPAQGSGPRHRRVRTHRHPLLRRTTYVVALLLVLALGATWGVLRRLDGNITAISFDQGLGSRPTSSATTDAATNLAPMNLLVLGIDDRSKLGTDKYGSAVDSAGARSDTTLLVHLAADRKSAVIVSIPRDTMIQAPRSCKDLTASPSTWHTVQFNSIFEAGGVPCVVKVVESETGIRVDHVLTLDFNGFKTMVNALGSVPVCVTRAVDDKLSGLKLPAGTTRLNGEQALAFVRLRHVGDGSDTQRMSRQQAFLAAMMREATSTSLLLNPAKLYSFLDAATKSLSTDRDLASVTALGGLANELRGLQPGSVHMLTAPSGPWPQDPNRTELLPAAEQVWSLIAADRPWGSGATSSPTPSPTPTTAAPLTVSPATIGVAVENAAGLTGYGGQVAQALRVQGFQVGAVTSTTTHITGVVVHHTAAQLEAARTVAAAFPGATLKADGAAGSPIRVTVGQGAKAVVAVPNRTGTAPLPAQPLTAPTPTSSATISASSADEAVCSDTGTG